MKHDGEYIRRLDWLITLGPAAKKVSVGVQVLREGAAAVKAMAGRSATTRVKKDCIMIYELRERIKMKIFGVESFIPENERVFPGVRGGNTVELGMVFERAVDHWR